MKYPTLSVRLGSSNGYLPIPTSFGIHTANTGRFPSRSSLQRRWQYLFIALVCAGLLVVTNAGILSGLPALELFRTRPEGWGLSESEGWKQAEGLLDLGKEGEDSFLFGFEAGQEGSRFYFSQLVEFIQSLPASLQPSLTSSLSAHLPPSLSDLVPRGKHHARPLIDYKTIYQTDASASDATRESSAQWSAQNPGWELAFYDDERAEAWTRTLFKDSQIVWAWEYMKRGVLRADFFRYLIPLIEGGIYTDVDVKSHKAIEEWGTHDVEYLSLASTDGRQWRKSLARHPAVIVGVDVDVHQFVTWKEGWPRPFGICQWTLGAAPGHPIFLDVARRVVNATKAVEKWEDWRVGEIQRLRAIGRNEEADELGNKPRGDFMSVVNWTGPGPFTDAVLAFLLARYNTTWHRLRGLDHPLRIGDVLILPITAFSPGGHEDFHSGSYSDIQGAVEHDFRGSWKGSGW